MTRTKITIYTIIPLIVLIAAIIALSDHGDSIAGNRQDGRGGLAEEAPALLTGGAITLWDGVRCFSSLRMQRMDLVPKRWGIFQWADARDIVIHDCRIRMESAALASCFEEIGKTLFQLAQSGVPSTEFNEDQAASTQGEQRPALVPLPPKVEVHNFSCTLSHPQDRLLTLKADLATFEPPQPVVSLEGRVQVTSDQGSVLRAEALDWLPLLEKIQVKTEYKFGRGQGRRGSRPPAWFSLAGGRLKRSRPPRVTGPADPGPVVVLPPNIMAAAATGKNPASHKNKLLSLMFMGLFQASTPHNVQPLPASFKTP
jgi:hypothetical protein